MSTTPAQVTEAHRKLAEEVMFLVNYGERLKAARLIADGEARAVAVALADLTCTHHTDKERQECPVCVVSQLRAEVERVKAQSFQAAKEGIGHFKRAERAEDELATANKAWELSSRSNESCLRELYKVRAELAKERARLDWILKLRCEDETRADIDAATQEDAK